MESGIGKGKKKAKGKTKAKKPSDKQTSAAKMLAAMASGAEGGDGSAKDPYVVSMVKGDKCMGRGAFSQEVCHSYKIHSPAGSVAGEYLFLKGWSETNRVHRLTPEQENDTDFSMCLPETLVDESKLSTEAMPPPDRAGVNFSDLSQMTAEQADVPDRQGFRGVIGGGYKNKKRSKKRQSKKRTKKRQSKKRKSTKRKSRKRLKTKKR